MIRSGLGYDVHRLVDSKPLYLGGVKITYSKGLDGHSDADVILHAITDALLGAAGLADIGTYFSNKDPRWKNVSSLIFLEEVRKIYSKKKIKIINIDSVLLSEEPKIAPYISSMKEKISKALKIKPSAIGIKASTNERIGFVGRKEGMASMAIALIQIS
jgi:2-C-methyl-D-erythritol 2,4-cyclodiphosphate synthase